MHLDAMEFDPILGPDKAQVVEILEASLADPSGWTINGQTWQLAHVFKDVGDWILMVSDSSFALPGPALVHDHPWPVYVRDFFGHGRQYRFEVADEGEPFLMLTVVDNDGTGPRPTGPPEPVFLKRGPLEQDLPGLFLEQDPSELHLTLSGPEDDGLVSVARRFELPPPPLRQRVAWPADQTRDHRSTKRPATPDEVVHAVSLALARVPPTERNL
jgi:hypothetical protein